jgi:hypothetical protein
MRVEMRVETPVDAGARVPSLKGLLVDAAGWNVEQRF